MEVVSKLESVHIVSKVSNQICDWSITRVWDPDARVTAWKWCNHCNQVMQSSWDTVVSRAGIHHDLMHTWVAQHPLFVSFPLTRRSYLQRGHTYKEVIPTRRSYLRGHTYKAVTPTKRSYLQGGHIYKEVIPTRRSYLIVCPVLLCSPLHDGAENLLELGGILLEVHLHLAKEKPGFGKLKVFHQL